MENDSYPIEIRVFGETYKGRVRQTGKNAWKAHCYINARFIEGEPARSEQGAIDNLKSKAESSDITD